MSKDRPDTPVTQKSWLPSGDKWLDWIVGPVVTLIALSAAGFIFNWVTSGAVIDFLGGQKRLELSKTVTIQEKKETLDTTPNNETAAIAQCVDGVAISGGCDLEVFGDYRLTQAGIWPASNGWRCLWKAESFTKPNSGAKGVARVVCLNSK